MKLSEKRRIMSINIVAAVFLLILPICFLTACTQSGIAGDTAGEIIGNSPDREIAEILADCADKKIEQRIEGADGVTLLINADVKAEGVERVSQYEYVLTDVSEETRSELFKAVFGELADKAEYDEMNDVWTLTINSETRNYFLYHISYANGGTTIPGEQIMILENRYYDLYPFEDNRLLALADSRGDFTIDEAADLCGQVVEAVTDRGDYVLSYVHAYGNNGRRPYLKLVFKRVLDGMQVTAYNDLNFLFDDNGIEKVMGALFAVKEIGLEKAILPPDEAVVKLCEEFVPESSLTVTEITLEYITLIAQDGRLLITPVWRFWLGGDEDERNFNRQKILAVNAVTGQVIWEERGHTM